MGSRTQRCRRILGQANLEIHEAIFKNLHNIMQGRGAEWSLDATKLEKLWNDGWTTFAPTWKTPEGVRTW